MNLALLRLSESKINTEHEVREKSWSFPQTRIRRDSCSVKFTVRLIFWVLLGLEDDRLASDYLIWILDMF